MFYSGRYHHRSNERNECAGYETCHRGVKTSERSHDQARSSFGSFQLTNTQMEFRGHEPVCGFNHCGQLVDPINGSSVTIAGSEEQYTRGIGEHGGRRDQCQYRKRIGGNFHQRAPSVDSGHKRALPWGDLCESEGITEGETLEVGTILYPGRSADIDWPGPGNGLSAPNHNLGGRPGFIVNRHALSGCGHRERRGSGVLPL
jgi:hypothetical protein